MSLELYVSSSYLRDFQEYEQEMIAHSSDEALEMLRVAIAEEKKYRIDPNYFASMQVGDFTPRDRKKVICWFGEVVRIQRLPPSFMFRAANVMDRFFSQISLTHHAMTVVPPSYYAGGPVTLVAIAAIDLAVKAELGDGITPALLESAQLSYKDWAPILLEVWQGVGWVATNWTAYTFLEYLFFLLPRQYFRMSTVSSPLLAARLSFSITSLDASQLLLSQRPPASPPSPEALPYEGYGENNTLTGGYPPLTAGTEDGHPRFRTSVLRSQQSQDVAGHSGRIACSQGSAEGSPTGAGADGRRFTIATSTLPLSQTAQNGTPEVDSPAPTSSYSRPPAPFFSQFCRDVCVTLHYILADAKFLKYTPSEQAGAALFVTMCTSIQDSAAHTAIINLIHKLRDTVGLSVHNLKECAHHLHTLISQRRAKGRTVCAAERPEAQARAKR